ncbi:MAG: oxidative damage protection protein [bacterium]
MAIVECSRCSDKKEGLSDAPFNNELGQKVLDKICQDCWQQWIRNQLMLMNEHRLDPLNDEHSKFLDEEMLKFLNIS